MVPTKSRRQNHSNIQAAIWWPTNTCDFQLCGGFLINQLDCQYFKNRTISIEFHFLSKKKENIKISRIVDPNLPQLSQLKMYSIWPNRKKAPALILKIIMREWHHRACLGEKIVGCLLSPVFCLTLSTTKVPILPKESLGTVSLFLWFLNKQSQIPIVRVLEGKNRGDEKQKNNKKIPQN